MVRKVCRMRTGQRFAQKTTPNFHRMSFRRFQEFDFNHVTSSPHFPKSNGLAEKEVQNVNRILKKCDDAGEYVYLGLLNYRSCALVGGRSPGELPYARKDRT